MNEEPDFDYISIVTNSIRDAIELAKAADLGLDELPESTSVAERIRLETQVSLAKSAAAASGLALHEVLWKHGERVRLEQATRLGERTSFELVLLSLWRQSPVDGRRRHPQHHPEKH